jgi:glycosyltransferase involved in cell wall biosynthesis
VLSVGALEAHKGFDFLVHSLSFIPAERRPPLVIAANDGNVELERRLRDLAAKLGVDLRIRMRPQPERLAELYADSLVFLYAPLGEPLGLAPLEAMSFGTPVLAVGDAGVCESVGDAGILVERNPKVMAANLGRLLASRYLRTSLGDRGREHVAASWTWDSRLFMLERELEALAESGAPRR